jgi:Holliday junction resolvase
VGKTEQRIQTEIVKYIESIGGYVVKVMVANSNGTPDLICCIDGKFLAIEVKKDGGKVSELQKHHIKKIQVSGGEAIVAYSVDDVYAHLSNHSNISLEV